MIVVHKNNDISEYITTINWGGSLSEVARKLELAIVNAPNDKNIKPLIINLADMVYLYEDDGTTELFRGFVVEREANSTSGTFSIIAYDLAFYTLKSYATYNFSKKTAETITKLVCDDLQIPVGKLAQTGVNQKLIANNLSIYEIIMKAYTNAFHSNGKLYRLYADKGLLNVEVIGDKICDVELSDDSNILNASYRESINNMINKIKIYDGEGKEKNVVENKELTKKYGIFQATYTEEQGKNAVATAKNMFVGVEKTYTLECIGNTKAVTGSGAIIYDKATGLRGLVWITSDVHRWEGGAHITTLSVNLKKIMDKKEE